MYCLPPNALLCRCVASTELYGVPAEPLLLYCDADPCETQRAEAHWPSLSTLNRIPWANKRERAETDPASSDSCSNRETLPKACAKRGRGSGT